MVINARNMDQEELCRKIRKCSDKLIQIRCCCGQRYLGCGMSGHELIIEGTPGNALGAYLDGGTIRVEGNAQDAVGDTMNNGSIFINGSAGDALGYAMRGGSLFVRGNAGYRAGVHMKAYGNESSTLVIGGMAGSFLGEYQAGGRIIVLGIGCDPEKPLAGYFCGNGMYSGRIYMRTDIKPRNLSPKLRWRKAEKEDMDDIEDALKAFADAFSLDSGNLIHSSFMVIEPNKDDAYRQQYAAI